MTGPRVGRSLGRNRGKRRSSLGSVGLFRKECSRLQYGVLFALILRGTQNEHSDEKDIAV